LGQTNKSKLMNDTQMSVRHPRPPRPVRILANAIATTILRSPWHRMRSDRLLLLTFTGRKSGKEFTTPMRYVQEGETLRLRVVYPWWKNLVDEAMVRVLLRGEMRTGTAEVLPEEDGEVVVKIHLTDK
jgi:F420H(2)-dependent quinone reductase